MRIVQVAPYFRPHVGGVESHVETISEELARRGHEVRVLTSRLPGTAPREVRRGVAVERVPTLANVLTTPISPATTARLLGARADVVHSHSPPPLTSFFAARAARAARTPHVLTYHCDLEVPRVWGPAAVEVYRRSFGAYTIRNATVVVATTSTYARTSRMLWRRDDVRVIPNAVDAERFNPENEGEPVRARHGLDERPVALFVGRLTLHKGLEHFIRAAEFTPPEVAHLIVGDGPRRAALERLARDLRLEGKVVFAGRAEPDELPAYYAAATCAVLPSTSRLEAFGIAALEAMATARPVVASRIPGVNEVVVDGETGLLAEPLDARDLAEKITRVVTDGERARAMGKAARDLVLRKFTVERVVDELERAYVAAASV